MSKDIWLQNLFFIWILRYVTGSLLFSSSLLCSLVSRTLFNYSCAFKIRSLSSLTHFNSALKSFTICRSSNGLSFLLSFKFTHISPSLMLPYSLFTRPLGRDSSSRDIPTSYMIPAKQGYSYLHVCNKNKP